MFAKTLGQYPFEDVLVIRREVESHPLTAKLVQGPHQERPRPPCSSNDYLAWELAQRRPQGGCLFVFRGKERQQFASRRLKPSFPGCIVSSTGTAEHPATPLSSTASSTTASDAGNNVTTTCQPSAPPADVLGRLTPEQHNAFQLWDSVPRHLRGIN